MLRCRSIPAKSTEALIITAETNTKTYDGTKSAAAKPTITSGTLANGDTPNFSEKFDSPNVGTGLTLTPAGQVNDGNGGNNYTYTFDAVDTGEIDAEALIITAEANTKTYDGTKSAAATPTITSGTVASRRHANVQREIRLRRNVGTGLDANTEPARSMTATAGTNYTVHASMPLIRAKSTPKH